MDQTQQDIHRTCTVLLDEADVKTYLFNADKDMDPSQKPAVNTVWQIIPSICACLPCLIFGMMLGWPCPTFPRLLEEDAEIPITWDLSALIAGFLMIGNLFGATFSPWKPFGVKFGIVVGAFLMLIGWIVMWQAIDVTSILSSRFIIGFGNGYALVRIGEYLKQICDPIMRTFTSKFAMSFMMLGVIVACTVGAFLTFRMFGLVASILSFIVFGVIAFLPRTPEELIRFGKIDKAERIIKSIKPNSDFGLELDNLQKAIQRTSEEISLWQLVRNVELSMRLAVLIVLVFFQQFTGPPSILVFSTIIFDKLGCPNPELFSIVYVLFYFISLLFTSIYSKKFNPKYCMAITSFISSLLLLANGLLVYFLQDEQWVYLKALLMVIYIVIHSMGLGFIPLGIAQNYFPPSAFKVVHRVQFGFHSVCAIISTKLFQVVITYHAFYLGFVYFAVVGAVGTIYILVFIPYQIKLPT